MLCSINMDSNMLLLCCLNSNFLKFLGLIQSSYIGEVRYKLIDFMYYDLIKKLDGFILLVKID